MFFRPEAKQRLCETALTHTDLRNALYLDSVALTLGISLGLFLPIEIVPKSEAFTTYRSSRTSK